MITAIKEQFFQSSLAFIWKSKSLWVLWPVIWNTNLLRMVPSYSGNVIDAFRCFLYRDQTSLLHALKELGQLKNKREWRKIKLNQSKRDELLSTINSVKTVLSMTVNKNNLFVWRLLDVHWSSLWTRNTGINKIHHSVRTILYKCGLGWSNQLDICNQLSTMLI